MLTNFNEEVNTLLFRNSNGLQGSRANLITSKSAQFEALTNFSVGDFSMPMVLLYNEPWSMHLVNFNFKFPVDVLLVDERGVVRNAFTESFRDSTASYIRGFTSVKMVILCPKDYINKKQIIKNETIIELTSYENYYRLIEGQWRNDYSKMPIDELKIKMEKFAGSNKNIARVSREFQIMQNELKKKIKRSELVQLNVTEDEEIKLIFTSLIINIQSINKYYGGLQDFVQEYQINGYTNGKLFLITDMIDPSSDINHLIKNCLVPLGMRNAVDFVLAEEVNIDSSDGRPPYWHREHPQLIHIDWLGSICLEDGNWIWHKGNM